METGGPTYHFESHSDYCVLALKPGMNDVQWSEIEKVGDQVVRDLEGMKAPNLLVDLTELKFIGSAMVALVVRVWKVVKAKNAHIVVVNQNPLVLEVFQIAKLTDVWDFVEYREDGLDLLGVSRSAKAEAGESKVLALVTVFAALASAGAMGAHLGKPGLLTHSTFQLLACSLAGIGTVLGLLLILKSSGGRRAVGVLSTLVCLGVLVGAAFFVEKPAEAGPNAAGKGNQEQETPEKTGEPKSDDSGKKTAETSTEPPAPAVAEKPQRTPDE